MVAAPRSTRGKGRSACVSLLNFLVAFLPVIAGSTAVRYLSLFRSTVSFVSSSICFSGYDQMGTEEIDSQEENKFEGLSTTFLEPLECAVCS